MNEPIEVFLHVACQVAADDTVQMSGELIRAAVAEIAQLRATIKALKQHRLTPIEQSAGDYMAAAIDLMVYHHSIDPRSRAADARLCWGEPWPEQEALHIWNNAGHKRESKP